MGGIERRARSRQAGRLRILVPRQPRRTGQLILFLLALLVAPVRHAAWPSDRIKELLAKKVGEAVCFKGRFTGLRVNVWDYAKAKQVPVPGLFRFGEQVMRPEPAVYPDQEVTSLTVLLYRDGRRHECYDEMHDFKLLVTLNGWAQPLRAAGECPWSRPRESRKGETSGVANTTALFCGIDCDGGGMRIERIAGSREVNFRFEALSGGLRMSNGCSSNHLHLGGEARPFEPAERQARDNPAIFKLKPMSKEECSTFRVTVKGHG
jgi:hypothetical protein